MIDIELKKLEENLGYNSYKNKLYQIKSKEYISFLLCIFLVLIINYELFQQLKQEKINMSQTNFFVYTELLKKLANKYELTNNFKDINKYNEHTYLQYRLPEIKYELEQYDEKIDDYMHESTNRFYINGNAKYKIIKWYITDNNSTLYMCSEFTEKYSDYFKLSRAIGYAIPNLGFLTIIKLSQNSSVRINKLNLYLVNLMFIVIKGNIIIKKQNNIKKIGYHDNNEELSNSAIIMNNENIIIESDSESVVLCVEFMGHSTVNNNNFIIQLYKYYIQFL